MGDFGFGRYGVFPFDLGGGDPTTESGSVLEDEHRSILTSLSPGFDPSEGTEFYEEAYAMAMGVAMIWAINRRLRSWWIPEEMLESLRVWEEASGLRPSSSDTDNERRLRVAGKFRGVVNNAIGDLDEAARATLGAAYDGLALVTNTEEVAYWPGVNPGPPGFEWSTNRVIIGLKIDRSSLTEPEFISKRQALFDQLDSMAPAWMAFRIGSGDQFIVNQGIVGATFI